jgi:serine/threonine protein kinase
MVADFDFDDEYWSEISDAAKAFIRGLIVVDPSARPTAAQALQHPWIVQNVHGAANLQNRFNARYLFAF